MAGVIWPNSIGTVEVGVGRTWPRHENGVSGGSVGFGERAVVSIFVSCVIPSDGMVIRRPDVSSRRT